MFAAALTPSELLGMWERGEGQRPSRRALALLSGMAPDAPVGRRDAALLELRERLFGDAFAAVTLCPSCGEELELSFTANEVRRPFAGASALRIADRDVRLPGSVDLAAAEECGDVDAARELLFARCVGLSRDSLPPGVADEIVEAMRAADPQADVALDVVCPACAGEWREPFDIAAFLWTELSTSARRVLEDVHALASAYGWSEESILAMSPARRNAYLGMLR